jgi:uncharacterized protein YcaQ
VVAEKVSLATARRIALGAQGFAEPKAASIDGTFAGCSIAWV